MQPRPEDLTSLFDEVAKLFHRLRALAADAHQEGESSAARRGILRSLATLGPRTVPQLAAERPVSRQHVQSIVNTLLDDGFVELVPNPAHRRSSLVRLTRRGERRLSDMARLEQEMISRIEWQSSRAEIRAASATLAAVRAQISADA